MCNCSSGAFQNSCHISYWGEGEPCDPPGLLQESLGAPGPGDTLSDTPSDTPRFRGHSRGHSGDTSGPKGPRDSCSGPGDRRVSRAFFSCLHMSHWHFLKLSQWARRDRLMSRGKNCRETIFASHLSRSYPHRGVNFERG